MERRSIETLKTIADRRGGSEIEPYLLALYFKIIDNCLMKHNQVPRFAVLYLENYVSQVHCSCPNQGILKRNIANEGGGGGGGFSPEGRPLYTGCTVFRTLSLDII